MTLSELEAAADRDIDLNLINADFEKFMKNLGGLRVKWSSLLADEEIRLGEIEGLKSEITKKKLKELKYESDLKIDNKDIQVFLEGDTDIKDLNKILRTQQVKINFCNNILKAIEQNGFLCNNILKFKIWQSGSSV